MPPTMPTPPHGPVLTRRGALLGLGAAFTLGRASIALAAAPTERRFVVVRLRGALDGLSLVTPYGDPALAGLRGHLAPAAPGQAGGLLDLGGFYGLHPSMQAVHAMYAAGEVLPVHAVAGHYRSRSHFEAQDYLESGADQRLASGWLNRAVQQIAAPPGQTLALSVGLSAPLLLRGAAPVGNWAPDHWGAPSGELYGRIARLAAPDPVLGPALAEGLRQRGLDTVALGQGGQGGGSMPSAGKGGPDQAFVTLAATAGRLLAAPGGPRVAALELGGWDTHSGQVKRLEAQLRILDAGLAALKAALGPAWRATTVLCVTEFGRTVHANGTGGTDHGTGTAALILGGAAAGGQVRADWPGLGAGRLLDNRDLQPTADLRSVAKGLLRDHLGLAEGRLDPVFPGSTGAAPMAGLVRS